MVNERYIYVPLILLISMGTLIILASATTTEPAETNIHKRPKRNVTRSADLGVGERNETGDGCSAIDNPNKELLRQSSIGNLTAIQFILRNCNGTDVNTVADMHLTPLQYASLNGHLDIVQFLLGEDGIEVNNEGKVGVTALFIASERGSSDVVKVLLESPDIDINKGDNRTLQTALIASTFYGHTHIVKLLLQTPGIDINKPDREGITPLIMASSSGYIDGVRLLLQSPKVDLNKGDKNWKTALYGASRYGHSEVAKLLLQRPGIDINREYVVSPQLTMPSPAPQSMTSTITTAMPTNLTHEPPQSTTLLWMAYDNGQTEIVQLLLEQPQINVTKGITKDRYGNIKIAKLISDDNFNMTPSVELLVASIVGETSKVESLLYENETDINAFDSYERTSLLWASRMGNTEVVTCLLNHSSIQVNKGRSTDGGTALYLASKNGHAKIVQQLIEHPEILVITATLSRETPLIAAASNGQWKVMEVLLAIANIDVNHATFDGKSALFYAVLSESYETLELILRCPKTDTSLMDAQYKTALSIARDRNYTELVELLVSRGTLQITKGQTCCSDMIDRGLHTAVHNEDLKWINTFLMCPKLDINVHNGDGVTPLNFAIGKGLKEIVDIFLGDPRIDVNKPNVGQRQNAMLIASGKKQVVILKMLLLHPQTFVNEENTIGQSALSLVLQRYNKSESLTINGPSGIRVNNERHFEDFRMVKLLLRCPKTVASAERAKNYSQEIEQVFDMQTQLIDMRATCCLNVKENLLAYAMAGDFRAIRGLLKCPGSETNMNVVDNKGRTPLYIASMMGHTLVVEVLLDNKEINTDVGILLDGGTAFSVASEKVHQEVKKLLIVHGQIMPDFGPTKSKGWCSDNWTRHLTPCNRKNKSSETHNTHESSQPTIQTQESAQPTPKLPESTMRTLESQQSTTSGPILEESACHNANYFSCAVNTSKCIPWQWVCDNDTECPDGNDESQELCWNTGKCGGNYTATNGLITSPSYPFKYPDNQDCIYTISQSVGTLISITFHSMDIEQSETCSYDYLTITTNSTTSHETPDSTTMPGPTSQQSATPELIIGRSSKLCGNQVPAPFQTLYGQVTIRFHSDLSVCKNGFLIEYSTNIGSEQLLSDSAGAEASGESEADAFAETEASIDPEASEGY